MHGRTHIHTQNHTFSHASLQEKPLKHGIAFYFSCCADWKRLIVSFFVCEWWKRIKMDNAAASAASVHHGRAQREDKERRSNRMMAQSHRMKNSSSLLMVQENRTMAISTRKCIITPRHWEGEKERERQKMCQISIECMMELMHGVTFGPSCVTKSDSFPSVDWLQSDKHGKHHTHHRLAAKQINKAPPAHMPERLTQIQIIKHTAYFKPNKIL